MAAKEYCDGHQELVQAVGRLEGGMEHLKEGQRVSHNTLTDITIKIENMSNKMAWGKGWIAGIGAVVGVITFLLSKLLDL